MPAVAYARFCNSPGRYRRHIGIRGKLLRRPPLLFFLLLRVKWYMQETSSFPKVKARIFIDEGFKDNGIALRIPTLGDVFADSQICFARSSSIYPIQLADLFKVIAGY